MSYELAYFYMAKNLVLSPYQISILVQRQEAISILIKKKPGP